MEKIRKNNDFRTVYRRGSSIADHYLVMYVLENGTGRNRIGISVSRKVGNSVVRHHLTRLIRESYRLHEDSLQPGHDIVVVARVRCKDAGYHDVERSLLELAGRHGILKGAAESN